MYPLIRALHLVLTAAVIPLGVLSFAPASGVARLAIFLLGSVLALFVIVLDQADYPLSLTGALRRTGPLLGNLGVGLWNGNGQVLVAAHWALTSLTAALAFALALTGSLALSEPSFRKERGIVYGLVFPLAAGATAVTVMLAWPLVNTLTASVPAILGVLAWLAQTLATTHAWLRQSVFSSAPETEEARERLAGMGPWNGPAALAVVAVMASLAFALLFTLR